MNRDMTHLEQRALDSSAKAGSLIRKLVNGSAHASLDALEKHVTELHAIRNEIADRMGRSALE